jgi:hypothetical protein
MLAACAIAFGGDFSSRTDKLKFRDAAGQTLYSIKFKDDGAKLVDGAEKELARLKIEKRDDGPELKIKSPDEKTLGYVSGKSPKWKLKDADKQTLFEVQREEDGSYKVVQTNKIVVYRLKPKDGGVEIEDGSQTVIRKVAVKDGKTAIRDASDKVVLMTSDPVTPVAIAFFGLEKFSKPQAAAMFLTLDEKPAAKASRSKD